MNFSFTVSTWQDWGHFSVSKVNKKSSNKQQREMLRNSKLFRRIYTNRNKFELRNERTERERERESMCRTETDTETESPNARLADAEAEVR